MFSVLLYGGTLHFQLGQDISLLKSMSSKERKKLNDKGIFTVNQLSYMFRPRRRPKRYSGKPEKYYHSLKALAIRERKIYVSGDERIRIDGTPIYLDIEAIPDREFYYLIGIRIPTPSNGIVWHSLWANKPDDQERIWNEFIKILSGVDNPIIIHYGKFEMTALRKMSQLYGAPLSDSSAGKAISSSINLLGYIYGRIYFPTYSNGLKEIASYLGFRWSMEDASGIHSILWRSEWDRSNDEIWKNNLIRYNADDCEALNLVTDFVREIGGDGIGEMAKRDDVVRVESKRWESPFKFRKNKFHFPAMEEINRTAYWDYNENKGKSTAQRNLRNKGSSRSKRPFNKEIFLPPPVKCPLCSSRHFTKHQRHSRVLVDLWIGQSGVKRWVTKNVFYRYRCCDCSFVFTDPKWKPKFGDNLRTMVVYMNIDLGVPQERIASFLNQIFGLQLSRGRTNKLKSKAAEFYRESYEKIIQKIIQGALIHADETRVNVKGVIGYIWVLTGKEDVAYIYSQTRESELIRSLLKDYKGVLISDFYSAYESINCPQQRCLIHLMRDLNDDLIREPFNEELVELVSRFTILLKPIIETIDRFGLKRRFLHKHKLFVDRFFKKMLIQEYQTETAVKCKRRFERNRNTLFTFLDYDGVPWNNNRAEHAIKALVRLRRDFSGVTTERGVKDYMVLLSLCETCRFKKIRFLEFLRSGELEIDSLVKKRKGNRRRAGVSSS